MSETNVKRIDYLDVLRVLACFMVIMTHAGDKYLINADGTFGAACSFFLSLLRPCVPLFILLSATLLLPLKTDSTTFFKKRFTRVLIPFLVWSILYVFLPLPEEPVFGGPSNAFTDAGLNLYLYNLIMVPMNFTKSNVHFWFIYTILGLYLFMPIISPWIQQASKRTLITFLSIWGVTLFFPYIRLWFPQIQGECDWNDFGMLYYFSGYFGYLVLGYFMHHYNTMSMVKSMTVGAILIAIGLSITYFGFLNDCDKFLVEQAAGNEDWKLLELSIGNLTFNVVMLTAGMFLFFQKINYSALSRKIFRELSVMSYGIFLVHYIVSLWLSAYLPKAWQMNEGFEQFLLSVLIFVISYVITKALSYLPKSKYLIG